MTPNEKQIVEETHKSFRFILNCGVNVCNRVDGEQEEIFRQFAESLRQTRLLFDKMVAMNK